MNKRLSFIISMKLVWMDGGFSIKSFVFMSQWIQDASFLNDAKYITDKVAVFTEIDIVH